MVRFIKAELVNGVREGVCERLGLPRSIRIVKISDNSGGGLLPPLSRHLQLASPRAAVSVIDPVNDHLFLELISIFLPQLISSHDVGGLLEQLRLKHFCFI